MKNPTMAQDATRRCDRIRDPENQQDAWSWSVAVGRKEPVDSSRRVAPPGGIASDLARHGSKHDLKLCRVDAVRLHNGPRHRITEQFLKGRAVVEASHEHRFLFLR
jgi:hypothetical protein